MFIGFESFLGRILSASPSHGLVWPVTRPSCSPLSACDSKPLAKPGRPFPTVQQGVLRAEAVVLSLGFVTSALQLGPQGRRLGTSRQDGLWPSASGVISKHLLRSTAGGGGCHFRGGT